MYYICTYMKGVSSYLGNPDYTTEDVGRRASHIERPKRKAERFVSPSGLAEIRKVSQVVHGV
jgi:hypothetical protein